MMPQDPARQSIEVDLQMRDLPPEVKALRERQRKHDAPVREVVKPRANAQIATCRMVAHDLRRWHQAIADSTDLDLVGYSRGSAIWLLAGRCLGLHEVLMVQAEAQIDNEGLVVSRALHEACVILLAFLANPDEEDLVRLWLDDEGKYGYVKQGAARAAQARFEREVNEAMEDSGMATRLSSLGTSDELRDRLYDQMSRTSHSRRSSCVSSLWQEGREMAYGRAPDAFRWAAAVDWCSAMTVDVAHTVGDALRAFFGESFIVEKINPLVQSVSAVRQMNPLDEPSILEAVARKLP